MRETGICSINKEHKYTHWGNNAEPVNGGRCCDDCNSSVVIPARLMRNTNLGKALRAIPSSARAEQSRINGAMNKGKKKENTTS